MEDAKGWICLDIDGTLTHEILSIPEQVLKYLEDRHDEGWKIVFVTGRIFTLGHRVLKSFAKPYYYIPQNGASWFEMPSQKMLGKRHLPLKTFIELEPIVQSTKLDFVLLSGIEEDDKCYYRPSELSKETLDYFQSKLGKYAGEWTAVESFKALNLPSVSMGKIYGPRDELMDIYPLFEKVPSIKTHLVVDSARPTHSIIQIMRSDVDKGKAVLELIKGSTLPKVIIAAGNDKNDETMLEIADVKIAMKDSPKEMLEMADIIAPPPEEMGILPALDQALERVKKL